MPTLTARLARGALRMVPLYNGKGRIIDRTFLSRLRFSESSLRVRTIDGEMVVNPRDLIGRHIYLTATFDRCVVDVLEALARPGDTLWDIGANIGYVSLAFLRRVPRSRVVAIEPLGDIFEMLKSNLPPERAACLRCAVSDRAGEGAMVRTPGNPGNSHLGDSGEPVRLSTAEQIVAHGRPDVVKIDTEGHEAAVMRGIAPVLPGVRAVVFECHRWPDAEVAATLHAGGFTVLNLSRRWSGWRLFRPGQTPRGYEPSPDYVAVRDADAAMGLGR